MRIQTPLTVAVALAAGSIVSAPSAHAIGAADCFRATGSMGYSGSNTYEVQITDRCGRVSTSDPDFGVRVGYTIDVGAYCFSRSGTVSRGTLGATERISLDCLNPGSHYPTVTFSSYSDGSYNTVRLSRLDIKRPETPRPSPTPTPTPSRTSTPTPIPITPVPTERPAAPSLNAGAVSKSALPAATGVSYTTKRRGTGRPTARLVNGELRVRIPTKLKPKSPFTVEVLGPVGVGNVTIRKPGGVTETRAFQDFHDFTVRKKGIVRFSVPVTAASEIRVRDSRDKTFLRLYASNYCLDDSRFTLYCDSP